MVIMKRIACQGILKQIFFNAKNYIGGDGRHFCCQSGCPEQVYSQRIYPGCSYGGDAHRSGSYGDDYGCCVGDENFRGDTRVKCYRGNVRCKCFRYEV